MATLNQPCHNWAFSVPLNDAGRAAVLRSEPDVKVAVVDNRLWLQGRHADESLLQRLSTLADGPVFRVDEQNRLTPIRQTVPTGKLASATWMDVNRFFTPVLPVAAVPHGQFARCTLQLQRSPDVRPAQLLVCDASLFLDWAVTAPEVRLRCLKYAVCRSTSVRVLVMGQPLPPLTGSLFWLAGQVALPLGYAWQPELDVAAMNAVLFSQWEDKPSPGTVAIWIGPESANTESHIEIVPGSAFVTASRSNARQIGKPT
ncbi:MAG: hypothetical protein R3C59_30585 [Planctomycetaceae bacterium]